MTLTTQGGAPIRYTLDGSDPTASSPLYKAPVTIGESCTFKAAALREGMQTPVYARKFDFNKATGRRIALNAAPTLKYTYGGASLLVDGYRGGPVYSNGAWIGFLNEPLDVTIDMQGAKPYSAVTVESLVEKGEWGFPAFVGGGLPLGRRQRVHRGGADVRAAGDGRQPRRRQAVQGALPRNLGPLPARGGPYGRSDSGMARRGRTKGPYVRG